MKNGISMVGGSCVERARGAYLAPCVKVVVFCVERGFDGSDGQTVGLLPGRGDIELENRTMGGNWGGESDEHWF